MSARRLYRTRNAIPPLVEWGLIAISVGIASCFGIFIGLLFGMAVIASKGL